MVCLACELQAPKEYSRSRPQLDPLPGPQATLAHPQLDPLQGPQAPRVLETTDTRLGAVYLSYT